LPAAVAAAAEVGSGADGGGEAMSDGVGFWVWGCVGWLRTPDGRLVNDHAGGLGGMWMAMRYF
jgi:hypothetical protein